MPLLAVNHHYFRTTSTGMGIYPTTPEQLTTSVHKIRSAGWRVGDQYDIKSYIAGETSEDKICIITFDDGLKEQLKAVKLLQDLGASAICFVPTSPLVEKRVLDVHKLQMIRSVTDDGALAAYLDKEFGFHKHEFDQKLLEIQYRYDNPLSRRVKYFINFSLTSEQREEWVSKLFFQIFGDEKSAADNLYMNKRDVQLLGSQGLMGSHGHSHVPMAKCSANDLTNELQRASEILRDLSNVRPIGVSYPYGGKSAVSNDVFSVATEVGYEYGFTMERGVNLWKESSPMAYKRIDTNDLDEWLVTH